MGLLVPGPEGRWKSATMSTVTVYVLIVVGLILAVVSLLSLSGKI